VLAESRGARGPNVVQGIERAQRSLYVNPLAIFQSGDTLRPYMEYAVPEQANTSFKVTVMAIPIRRDHGNSKRMVSVGPIVQVQDIEGQLWGDASPLKFDDESEMMVPDENEEIPLLVKSYARDAATGIFDIELPLEGIARGRYWIAVRVSDEDDTRSYGSAWTPIEIR